MIFGTFIFKPSRQISSIQPLSLYGFHIRTTKGHDTPIPDFMVDHHGLIAVFYLSAHYRIHSSVSWNRAQEVLTF
jgi:hypothetical protein